MEFPTGVIESEKKVFKLYKSYIITHRTYEHLLRAYNSFGISIACLNNKDLFPDAAKKILFIYHGEKGDKIKYYLVDIKDYENGLPWTQTLKNGKPDIQKHVPLKDMKEYLDIDDVPEPN